MYLEVHFHLERMDLPLDLVEIIIYTKKEEADYGVDLSISFHNGKSDDTVNDNLTNKFNIDSDFSLFVVGFRPHYDFGGIKVFADLGLLNLDIDNKYTVSGPLLPTSISDSVSGDSSEFMYGFGLEVSFSDKFTFQPSIAWSESPSVKASTGSAPEMISSAI